MMRTRMNGVCQAMPGVLRDGAGARREEAARFIEDNDTKWRKSQREQLESQIAPFARPGHKNERGPHVTKGVSYLRRGRFLGAPRANGVIRGGRASMLNPRFDVGSIETQHGDNLRPVGADKPS